jgi:integrase
MLKTSASERTLKLAPLALGALQEHLARLAAEGWPPEKRMFALPDGRLAPLLLVNSAGQPLHHPAVRLHSFKKILQRAGLPDIRFHDLRHTAASLMLHKGFSILAVSKWLGHAKPSTTLNIYAKLLVDDRAKMADELDMLMPSYSG